MSESQPSSGTHHLPQGQQFPPAPQPGQPYSAPGQQYQNTGQPYPPTSQPAQPSDRPSQSAQPGQPYAQPGQPYAQPGQPYAQPGQPYGTPHPTAGSGTPGSPKGANPLGRTAFLVAVLSVGFGLVSQLLLQFLYANSIIDWIAMGAVPSILNFLVFVGAATGIVLGIAALRRPAPHLLAAIAIGLAVNTVLGTLASGLSSVFYNFF
ncbi:hypothetical protein GCM10009588_01800 [Microbacterium phyllosphaerae]